MRRHEHMTDAELLRDATRDASAFGYLHDRHAARLYRWTRSEGLGEADALDLVAEVFARAWVSRKRFRDPGDGGMGPWLYGIARNLVASHRRSGAIEARARKRLRLPVAATTEDMATSESRLDAAALRSNLKAVLESLPEGHKSAVRLRVLEGLDYPEIASRLGCTETTARKWVSLGLRGARARLEATSAHANP